jgi:sugar lactone lactonase YvrE
VTRPRSGRSCPGGARLRLVALAVAAVVAAPPTIRAAQPQFWKIEGAQDFLDGDTEGLSVDSEGRVRLAPATRGLPDTDAPFVWCLARDNKGALYAGTGNDGKVFRMDDGKATALFDAAELEVHALAVGPDGRLYAGTSPDGKVYAIEADGKAETFYDPADKYVWALAFDRAGRLLVGTGSEGRIHRVDKDGKAEILLASSETHITALAVDLEDNVYAGSSPGGILYRIDPAGKVFVLHDSPYREVKSLDVAKDGSLYAAVIDGKEKEEPVRAPTTMPIAPGQTGEATVTITESFAIVPPAVPAPSPSPRPLEAARSPGGSRSAVLRLLPSGEVDTLWSSADETPHAILRTEDGLLVGTGNKGKIYRVRDDRTWSMIATLPAQQVTALLRGPGGAALLATSNPGKVFELGAAPGAQGTFTSKVKDTETVSSWGRLAWEAELPAGAAVQVLTRSGNTGTPDSTWSDWSSPYARQEGDPITSQSARFLQVKVVMSGKDGASPVLESVSAAYLQRNLRPQVQSVTVHPPGEVFQKPLSISGEMEILGLEPGQGPEPPPGVAGQRPAMPPATAYSRKLYQKGIQTFSWKADDPNDDTLSYDVQYRSANDKRFRILRKGLTDPVVAWDTTTVPNGRYVIRVSASDAPSNPEGLALTGDKESSAFDVDNTPPTVTAVVESRSGPRVRAVARDDSSLIRKAEYSVDGGTWRDIHPTDGINDEKEESYEVPLTDLTPPGPHVVVVRATDLLGNVSTARVDVP